MEDQSDKARDQLLKELENVEWDLSEEALEKVAGKLKRYFKDMDEARDFVDVNASYLFQKIEEDYS
jgi:hypothetical protein